MQPCKKIKHPCKICFDHVSKKNGLRCQGACQKWAHYKCLNYTPGKIHDIKSGVIKITCPCPDCNTTEPKEVLVNPPYSCNNTKCPANKLPVCASHECPSNENPIPTYPVPPVCTPAPQDRSCSPVSRGSRPASPTCPARRRAPSPKTCPPSKCRASRNTSCSNQCSPKRSKSCSNVQVNSGAQYYSLDVAASDSKLPVCEDQQAILAAVKNLCNTVGQLSLQLKDLMCKIK